MNIFKYIFSNEIKPLYAISLCNGCFAKQFFVHKPYVRQTTLKKWDAAWMRKHVAECLASKAIDVGYIDAKIKKVHWWDILIRQLF